MGRCFGRRAVRVVMMDEVSVCREGLRSRWMSEETCCMEVTIGCMKVDLNGVSGFEKARNGCI